MPDLRGITRITIGAILASRYQAEAPSQPTAWPVRAGGFDKGLATRRTAAELPARTGRNLAEATELSKPKNLPLTKS